MVRTKHQQRNQKQRRKCAHWTGEEPQKMLFQSTQDFFDKAKNKMMREVRSFRRGVA